MRLGDREFTSEEVAALCGVTRVTVADWIARGRLDVRWTSGGHRRIPRASLADFMARQGYAVPRVVASGRALVLALDDEPAWRERLVTDLGHTGEFDIEALAPGVDALLAIGARTPDALLLDTRMPGFDARQVFEAVRAEPRLSEMVVVALTTHDEEAAAVKRFGADAALPRARIHELHELLVRMLTERQRRVTHEDGDGTTETRQLIAPRAPRVEGEGGGSDGGGGSDDGGGGGGGGAALRTSTRRSW